MKHRVLVLIFPPRGRQELRWINNQRLKGLKLQSLFIKRGLHTDVLSVVVIMRLCFSSTRQEAKRETRSLDARSGRRAVTAST